MKKKTTKVRKSSSSGNKRKFSPYELNLIRKAEFDADDVLESIGEDQPVEYYLNFAEFRQKLYRVNEHTLIPRVETEEIIDLAVKYLELSLVWDKLVHKEEYHEEILFADVGTGSGAIGISFANELKKKGIVYTGYLSDISEEALDVAIDNVRIHSQKDLKILRSDLFATYPQKIKFDVIFANLPYIPSDNVLKLEKSVKNYEPIIALDGGHDGLRIILICIKQAINYLKKDGMLILEVDDSHTKIPKEEGWILQNFRVDIHKDSFGRNRFWVLHKL